jgi:hypothetical protein
MRCRGLWFVDGLFIQMQNNFNRLKANFAMRAVAKRLVARLPATAQRDGLACRYLLVAVGINVGCSPRNDVRAVVSGFDFNLCHSLPPVQEYDLDIIVNIDILSMFISENLDKIWQI